MNFLKKGELSRRHFMAQAAAAYLGVNAISGLNNQLFGKEQVSLKSKVDSVIYIFLKGGLSQIDSFDIKPDFEGGKNAGALKTSLGGYRVSKYFPKMAKQMDKMCVINSLSTGTAAHEQAQYLMNTSYEMRGTIKHPHLGAWASKYLPSLSNDIPPFIKINPGHSLGRGYFAAKYSALPIGDPALGLQNSRLNRVSEKDFQQNMAMLRKMNSNFGNTYKTDNIKSYTESYEGAVNLMKSSDLEVFDITKEKKSVLDSYGKSQFGKACLLARRLAEKKVRFIDINLKGWDHHYGIYENEFFPSSANTLDEGLSALIADLSQRGMLDKTMVCVVTEFGRAPTLDIRKGRIHYPTAFSSLLAGGPIKRGYVHGKTDAKCSKVTEGKMDPSDLNATIATAMGLDYSKEIKALGRPFKIAHKGKPEMTLFS
ncbi:MAG: DUF1501 domain-containing protein [Planctomycetes bacterium]|nr:DUF1501 domain-containing protein [Planctomycetota bacterium]